MFHIKLYKNTLIKKKNKRTLKQATLRPSPMVTFVPRGSPRNKSSKKISPPKMNKQQQKNKSNVFLKSKKKKSGKRFHFFISFSLLSKPMSIFSHKHT